MFSCVSSGPRVSFADVSSALSPEVWTSSVQTASSVVSGTICVSTVDVCVSLAAVSDPVCTCVSAVVSSIVLSTAAYDVSNSDAIVFTGVSVVDTLISTAISVEVSLFPFLFLGFIVISFLTVNFGNFPKSFFALFIFIIGGSLRRIIYFPRFIIYFAHKKRPWHLP